MSDLERDGESLPMANGCGVGCGCSGYKGEERESNVNYLSNAEFVDRFASVLLSYLNKTYPEGESHIVDLTTHALTFMESFYLVTNEF